MNIKDSYDGDALSKNRLNKPKFLTKPFRKCPSCKQDAVETSIMPQKVIVQCKKCPLKYEFNRYPAFEEIDYYNKMLDIFRKEKLK